MTKNAVAGTVDAVNQLGSYLDQLSQLVSVDIIPGANDPSNITMPQQPLHPCMLDKNGYVNTLPNPCQLNVNGTQ